MEILKTRRTKENEKITYKNLWHPSAKVELQWKFVILNDYIRKGQKLKIDEVNVQL